MNKGDKEFRAAYFREYRKSNPKRLENAETDAARKRENRGGYKSPEKQYSEMLATLPLEQQEIVRAFFEYPQDALVS
jgi:hypothetical protein